MFLPTDLIFKFMTCSGYLILEKYLFRKYSGSVASPPERRASTCDHKADIHSLCEWTDPNSNSARAALRLETQVDSSCSTVVRPAPTGESKQSNVEPPSDCRLLNCAASDLTASDGLSSAMSNQHCVQQALRCRRHRCVACAINCSTLVQLLLVVVVPRTVSQCKLART